MLDSNTAALKQHMNEVDAWEASAPTQEEIHNFVEDWFQRNTHKKGIDFVAEALCESPDVEFIGLFQAFKDDDKTRMGEEVVKIVRGYWLQHAIEAAESHDYSEERKLAFLED